MIHVKKATFLEAITFLKPALRELNRLAVPYEVNENKMKILIKIPKYIPEKIEDPYRKKILEEIRSKAVSTGRGLLIQEKDIV